jgi:endonuclease III
MKQSRPTLDNFQRAIKIIHILRRATESLPRPMVDTIIETFGNKPYLVLISCLLSLRAKDTTTLPVCLNLFQIVQTPFQMVALPLAELEHIIFKSGFYRQKARTLKFVSQVLVDQFHGKVPKDKEALLAIKGIGDKTANLVLYKAFNIPALFVDTHVHRVSNRLGLIKTKTPKETQKALEKLLPSKYWGEYAHLIVTWGQNVCVPISPFCSKCALFDVCERVGVKRSR